MLKEIRSAGFVAKSEANSEARSVDSTKEDHVKKKKICGYTAVYDKKTLIRDWWGEEFEEIISRGAFSRAIAERQDVRALRNHDSDNLLGRTVSGTLVLKEDSNGLWIEIDPPDTSVGRDTVELVSRGDLSGMSFAFVVTRERWEYPKGNKPLRYIEDVDLYDVGPVTYPAYDQTTALTIDKNEDLKRKLDEVRAAAAKKSSVDDTNANVDEAAVKESAQKTSDRSKGYKIQLISNRSAQESNNFATKLLTSNKG